ncbi:S-layer homology domain-containing protein [Paenibacillaceae bacterium]|nr:S-layer homology domain-containing protein [Paenibacillaceae bacterium]
MKKMLMAAMMFTLLLFTLGQSVFAFSDIESDKNANKIRTLKEDRIIAGQNGLFNPQGELTYAAGIAMIVKGLDINLDHIRFIKKPEASDYYTKVKDGVWYSEPFIIASVNGLDVDKDVNPGQAITREQFAHHLFQAIQTKGERAYIEIFHEIKDQKQINPDYSDSIQKLLVTNIVQLDQAGNFNPKSPITRSEAAGWLYDAIALVNDTPAIEEPVHNPLADVKLSTKAVNDKITEVTITAQAPHPGYGIRIASIVFEEGKAIITTEPVLPDPDMMYPQVITEVTAVTYVNADFEPVLAPAPNSGESTTK